MIITTYIDDHTDRELRTDAEGLVRLVLDALAREYQCEGIEQSLMEAASTRLYWNHKRLAAKEDGE